MPMGWVAGGVALAGLASGYMQSEAAKSAAQTQANAAQAGQATQLGMFNTLNAQNAPGRATGYAGLNTLGSMLPGQTQVYDAQGNPVSTQQGTGYLTQTFGPEQLQSNLAPNYQFMLQQGLGAVQQGANAAGGGSNVQTAATKFAEDYASNAYQNAFNNFQTQQSNIYNRLAGIAGLGQAAQTQSNQIGQNTANNITALTTGAGAAQAAGQVGSANAIAGGLSGLGSTGMLYSLMNQNANTGATGAGMNTSGVDLASLAAG